MLGDLVKRCVRLSFRILLSLTAAYLLLAYILIPIFLRHYEHRPELEKFSKTSFTRDGLPGDPLNVGLLCLEKELLEAMKAAGWRVSDPLKISSDFKIAEDVLLRKSYLQAPVSRLYLFNRPQDYAFEKEVGGSPARRHHVRFWRTGIVGKEGRPFWIGSATYDRSVGVSHYTAQLTHHIDADIDKERDTLFSNLAQAGQLLKIYQVSGVGPSLNEYNGGGDRYFTDGELTAGVITHENAVSLEEPKKLPNPVLVEAKNSFWNLMRNAMNVLD